MNKDIDAKCEDGGEVHVCAASSEEGLAPSLLIDDRRGGLPASHCLVRRLVGLTGAQ
jgi:hypothetical protein